MNHYTVHLNLTKNKKEYHGTILYKRSLACIKHNASIPTWGPCANSTSKYQLTYVHGFFSPVIMSLKKMIIFFPWIFSWKKGLVSVKVSTDFIAFSGVRKKILFSPNISVCFLHKAEYTYKKPITVLITSQYYY